jgi:hypothetical protein
LPDADTRTLDMMPGARLSRTSTLFNVFTNTADLIPAPLANELINKVLPDAAVAQLPKEHAPLTLAQFLELLAAARPDDETSDDDRLGFALRHLFLPEHENLKAVVVLSRLLQQDAEVSALLDEHVSMLHREEAIRAGRTGARSRKSAGRRSRRSRSRSWSRSRGSKSSGSSNGSSIRSEVSSIGSERSNSPRAASANRSAAKPAAKGGPRNFSAARAKVPPRARPMERLDLNEVIALAPPSPVKAVHHLASIHLRRGNGRVAVSIAPDAAAAGRVGMAPEAKSQSEADLAGSTSSDEEAPPSRCPALPSLLFDRPYEAPRGDGAVLLERVRAIDTSPIPMHPSPSVTTGTLFSKGRESVTRRRVTWSAMNML